MYKLGNALTWTQQGYELFAEEGLDGIQVERLARMLHLNKSGFYHYFGDMEVYWTTLLEYHKQLAEVYFDDIRMIDTIDPQLFHIMVDRKVSIMFQMQLVRCSKNHTLYNVATLIDQKEEKLIEELWSEYLGFVENPKLSMPTIKWCAT